MSTALGRAAMLTAGRSRCGGASAVAASRAIRHVAVRAASAASAGGADPPEQQHSPQPSGPSRLRHQPKKRVVSCSRIFSSMATSTTTTTTEEAGVSGRGGGGPRRRGFSSAVADEAGLTFDEQCMAEAEAEAEDVERRRRRQEEEPLLLRPRRRSRRRGACPSFPCRLAP
mmetsp:Transcript_9253/g.17300  ORF Transcript_9253/g.17300 Transcript_9253/m.17300 type:complete len:171 (-) Transcript_9253:118-630(-)